jgi:transcriptional regulator with XRE-family HTH domain
MKSPRSNFAAALRTTRRARGIAQEEFDTISSRTYISALERGIKQPTVAKVDSLAELLSVHPLTLLTLSYASKRSVGDVRRLLEQVQDEIAELLEGEAAATR